MRASARVSLLGVRLEIEEAWNSTARGKWLRVYGFGFRVQCIGKVVQGEGFRRNRSCFRLRGQGRGKIDPGFRVRVARFGFE